MVNAERALAAKRILVTTVPLKRIRDKYQNDPEVPEVSKTLRYGIDQLYEAISMLDPEAIKI